jgi:hypothetical protein
LLCDREQEPCEFRELVCTLKVVITSRRFTAVFLIVASTSAFLTGCASNDTKAENADVTVTSAITTPGKPLEPVASGPEVRVTDAAELKAALAVATPGITITMADGMYLGKDVRDGNADEPGRFFATTPGDAAAPITLRGTRAAVIDGGGPGGGYGLHLTGAHHWKLMGFTVAGASKGIVLDGSNHVDINGVRVANTGDEGVHFRSHSSDNILQNSEVDHTGVRSPNYGEGVYIGSAKSNWQKHSGGEPDRSDRTTTCAKRAPGTTQRTTTRCWIAFPEPRTRHSRCAANSEYFGSSRVGNTRRSPTAPSRHGGATMKLSFQPVVFGLGVVTIGATAIFLPTPNEALTRSAAGNSVPGTTTPFTQTPTPVITGDSASPTTPTPSTEFLRVAPVANDTGVGDVRAATPSANPSKSEGEAAGVENQPATATTQPAAPPQPTAVTNTTAPPSTAAPRQSTTAPPRTTPTIDHDRKNNDGDHEGGHRGRDGDRDRDNSRREKDRNNDHDGWNNNINDKHDNDFDFTLGW